MLPLNELPELWNRTIVLVLPLLFESPGCLNFYAVNIIFNLTLVPQILVHALSKG